MTAPSSSAKPEAPASEGSKPAGLRRKIAIVLVIAGICLGVVVTRAVWDGRTALHEGDAAIAAGDKAEAIARWRRTARWYVPLAPHVEGAYDRLEDLAREAEKNDDVETALAAWRGVRSSILATRSFYTPFEDRLDPANQRIAALMAFGENPALDPGKTADQRTQWHYELLSRDESPSPFWAFIALLGLATWLGGGFLFALRGVSEKDQLIPRTAATAGILVAVGLVVWMLGLHLA